MGALEEGQLMETAMCLELDDCGSDDGPDSESNREIEGAVRVLLRGLGEDHEREGIKKTPRRVAKAFRDGTRGYRQEVRDIVEGALFPEAGLENAAGFAGGAGGLVVVRDIDLFSYCESCLLPFNVKCHVGYVPSGGRVVGLSKLSRVADVFAKRLQDPQRLADEMCSALHTSITPAGVAVALQCWHIQLPETMKCNANPMHPSKSDMQGWIPASFCSSSGMLKKDSSSFWNDFVALLSFRGVHMDLGSSIQPWCPLKSLELPQCNGHSTRSLLNGKICPITQSDMVSAVALIIRLLGEDPLRKELVHTPYHYVHWLMNFKTSVLEPKQNGFGLGSNCLRKRAGGIVDHGQGEIYSELNLPFCSQCEHHLLPFYGVVHVGYFVGEEREVIDRSFLQSLVHFYGCKLQVHERVTRQIAETVYSVVGEGVMVVVEASHICMTSRGIQKAGCSTATIATMGRFSTDSGARTLFNGSIGKTTASGG